MNTDDEKIERTNQIVKLFNIKSGKELTEISSKLIYFGLHVCLQNL